MSDTIATFGAQHGGLRAIIRRHFDYAVPAGVTSRATASGFTGALIYTRIVDPAKLGLNAKGARMAFEQGWQLAKLGIIPKLILCGCDQRNYDGARFTAEGLMEITSETVPFLTCPAVTYPHYADRDRLEKAYADYGDDFVAMYLAGDERVQGLWSEPAEVFDARIQAAVEATYPQGSPVLFDLNYEQTVLLHYSRVEGRCLSEIPKINAWIPMKGGGIVIGADSRNSVAEFRPDLTLIEAM